MSHPVAGPLSGWVAWSQPPAHAELPRGLVMPLVDGTPHPLAERAALELTAELDAGGLLGDPELARAAHGKMFGVLVVDAGARGIGYLRAFSGMLARRWSVPGFAPPVFDEHEIAPFWSTGDAEISALSSRIDALTGAERAALERQRADCSRALYDRLLATYRIPDRGGRERRLTELFAPARPPAGAGDCAAPKLLAYAQRRGLRALALAELWWGRATADRWPGSFHPPCHRCTPILAHMLSG